MVRVEEIVGAVGCGVKAGHIPELLFVVDRAAERYRSRQVTVGSLLAGAGSEACLRCTQGKQKKTTALDTGPGVVKTTGILV